MTDTRRRVKLYALNADRQWDDRGTGHVSTVYIDRLKGMSLLVRSESDGSYLLESRIQPDTAYQKQQETLIVWSEGDNYDLALSFQERAGCDEIWAKICNVQGKDPSVDITQDIVEEEDDRYNDDDPNDMAMLTIQLPPCDVYKLNVINDMVASCLPVPFRREQMALSLETQNYIKKLLALFHECEDQQNLKALHKLYEIFKNIFLMNKNQLFEILLSEDTLFDVIGVFEYDPALDEPKRHREYLKSVSRFKEVIPFGNAELISKIHQTYRVQYIQDVVLLTPTIFEENMLSTLNSFIFFNKVEIVLLIQGDDKFLSELFRQIQDESTEEEKRRDLVLFLKEFCKFSQTLQPTNRETFFRSLSSLGVLHTLEVTLAMEDPVIREAAVDILTYVVEYSPYIVREYALLQRESCDQDQHLISSIIEQMICDPDPNMGMAVQLSRILRLLLDPENILPPTTFGQKSEKSSDFLSYFYRRYMHALVAPVLVNTEEDKPTYEDGQVAQLLSIILELLSFCIEHHDFHIRYYILRSDILSRILVLMMSKHTFLVLSSLRLLRKIIGLRDAAYNHFIVVNNLFEPVIEAFKRNNGRYNLLDSAIIEIFEYIKCEGLQTLCKYVIEDFGEHLDKIDYVPTFKVLRYQYEEQKNKMKDKAYIENVSLRRDPRQMDEEEEMWFNDDDVEEMDPKLHNIAGLQLIDTFNKIIANKAKQASKHQDLENFKRYNDLENVKTLPLNRSTSPIRNISLSSPHSTSPSSHPELQTTRKGGLVDYPDEDSDEEENEDDCNLNHKRAKISS